jgi:Single Cache domain 2
MRFEDKLSAWPRAKMSVTSIGRSLTFRENSSMFRPVMIAAASAAFFVFSPTAFAQGTAAEAKAMLVKAVAAVKADKTKALDQFNKGEGGFLVGDLYVFCANVSDGKIIALANPNAKQLLGTDNRALKDSTGRAYGEEIFAAAQKPEGQFTEVGPYLFPRPGADKTPVKKVSLVTRVDDLGCGVGYYP